MQILTLEAAELPSIGLHRPEGMDRRQSLRLYGGGALLFDEFHAQKDRELWETLYRGISARRQPVVAIITTAGDDRESICREEYDRACKVRDGVLADDSYLPIIFEALPKTSTGKIQKYVLREKAKSTQAIE